MGKLKKLVGSSIIATSAFIGISVTSDDSNLQTVDVDQTYYLDSIMQSAMFAGESDYYTYEFNNIDNIQVQQVSRTFYEKCVINYTTGHYFFEIQSYDEEIIFEEELSYNDDFSDFYYDISYTSTSCGSNYFGTTKTTTVEHARAKLDEKWVEFGHVSNFGSISSYTKYYNYLGLYDSSGKLKNPIPIPDDRYITLSSLTTDKTYVHSKEFDVILKFNFDYAHIYSIDYLTVNGEQLDSSKFTYTDDQLKFKWQFSDYRATDELTIENFQISGNNIVNIYDVNTTVSLSIDGPVAEDSGASIEYVDFSESIIDYLQKYSLDFIVAKPQSGFILDHVSIDGTIYDNIANTEKNDKLYFSIDFINEIEYGEIVHVIDYIYFIDTTKEVEVFHKLESNTNKTLKVSNSFIEDVIIINMYLENSSIYYGDIANLVIELDSVSTDVKVVNVNINNVDYRNLIFDGNKIIVPIINNFNYGTTDLKVNSIQFSMKVHDENLGKEISVYETMSVNTSLKLTIKNYIDSNSVFISDLYFDKTAYFSTEIAVFTIELNNPNGYDISKIVFSNGIVLTDFTSSLDNTVLTYQLGLSNLYGIQNYVVDYIELTTFNNTQVFNSKDVNLGFSFEVINYYYDAGVRINEHEFTEKYLYTNDCIELTLDFDNFNDFTVDGITINGVYYNSSKFRIQGNKLIVTVDGYTAAGSTVLKVNSITTRKNNLTKIKNLNYEIPITLYDSDFTLNVLVVDVEVLNKLYINNYAQLQITFTNFTQSDLKYYSITINGIEYGLDYQYYSINGNKLLIEVPVNDLGDTLYVIEEYAFTTESRIGVNDAVNEEIEAYSYDQYELLKDNFLSEDTGKISTFLATSLPHFYDSLWTPIRFMVLILPLVPLSYIVIKKIK